ncbi:DAK2 domain-containing protein [Bacillaceae bacterium]
MLQRRIDGKLFAAMLQAGARSLASRAGDVNALNVFPVPDGDTGTNMNLTMQSGVEEALRTPSDRAGDVAQAFASGLLMGARGNSGVILSQLFRGFAKAVAGVAEIDSKLFAYALHAGVETAYQAVMRPVEGTILTVAKKASKQAMMTAERTDDLVAVMEEAFFAARNALQRTPELLPVLRQVGVVDAGAQGLVHIYEGFLAALQGETAEKAPAKGKAAVTGDKKATDAVRERVFGAAGGEGEQDPFTDRFAKERAQMHWKTEEIAYGYCTELIIRLPDKPPCPFPLAAFREEIGRFGDSLLVVTDENLVKIHIHAERPGEVLNLAQRYGELDRIKIENMRQQHAQIVHEEAEKGKSQVSQPDGRPAFTAPTPAPKAPYGIVAVAMGQGIAEIFRSLGAERVIEGGQTMNPSTEDILREIESLNAEKVIILPNNGNVVLAAEQAARMAVPPTAVVPSRSIPQGLSALLAFDPQRSLEENRDRMTQALQRVKTGQVTYAVRDTQLEGIEIREGDYLGIAEGEIKTAAKDLLEAFRALVASLVAPEDEILTILYGEGVSQEQAAEAASWTEAHYPHLAIEVHHGGQPLYYFILAVE